MEYTLKLKTEIYRGKNIIKERWDKLKDLGNTALIVTGNKSSKLNGALADILKALDKCKIEYYIYDKIRGDLTLDLIEEGRNLAIKVNADFVIGLGGGASIDAAKAIGIMAMHKYRDIQSLFNYKKLCNLPIVAVPTTSGTGSEVSKYAVILGEENNKKIVRDIYPDLAFIDWRYARCLDEVEKENTLLNVFINLIEGYLNINSTYETDRLAEKGLSMWGEYIDGVIANKVTDDELEKLSEASIIGGILISLNGILLPRCMGYYLTHNKNLPYGIATTLLYPAYLERIKDDKKVNNIVSILGFTSLNDLQKMLMRLTVNGVVVNEDEIERYTKSILADRNILKDYLEDINYDDIYQIYYDSLIGKHRNL